MNNLLHITSGDIAGASLARAGLPGEVFVWHDILFEGPRQPGWPDEETLAGRALFLERATGGGLSRDLVLKTLQSQYQRVAQAASCQPIVLWFDACLFDQSMLAHILTCLNLTGITNAELLCVDAFPGIEPFHGLGQLQPEQLASLYGNRRPVSVEQFSFAALGDRAFATRDIPLLRELSQIDDAPLPHLPAAARRCLEELPDLTTGLGRLERLALTAIRNGYEKPAEIFAAVAAADTPPRHWWDNALWAKINGLAERVPPLVRIQGPGRRLPQWESELPLAEFRITPLAD